MSLRDFFSLIQKVLTFVWLLIWMASFNQHTYNTDNKTGCKGNALSRLLSYIKFEKKVYLNELHFQITVELVPISAAVLHSYNE